MVFVFVDPGRVTGYVFIGKREDGSLYCSGGEQQHEMFLDSASRWIGSGHKHIERMVVERFDITPTTYQTVKKKDPVWAIEQIGCLRTWCRWKDVPFELQARDAKGFDADGAKLKKLGWWMPEAGVIGEAGHRRDAARHAVSWLVTHGVLNPEVLL